MKKTVRIIRKREQNDGFFQRVYAFLQKIPAGKVVTYGDVAAAVGAPRSSRQVGYALHVNPAPGVIPCHRVVNRFGALAEKFAQFLYRSVGILNSIVKHRRRKQFPVITHRTDYCRHFDRMEYVR